MATNHEVKTEEYGKIVAYEPPEWAKVLKGIPRSRVKVMFRTQIIVEMSLELDYM